MAANASTAPGSIKKSTYAICAIVIAIILIDIYGAVSLFGMSKYQSVTESTETAYSQKVLESSDRSLGNCLARFSETLDLSLPLAEAEGATSPEDVLAFLDEEVTGEGVPVTGFAAMTPDGSLSSPRLQKSGLPNDGLSDASKESVSIIAPVGCQPQATFTVQGPDSVAYVMVVDLKTLLDLSFGSINERERSHVILHDPDNGFFIFMQDGTLFAEKNPSPNSIQNNGLSYLKEASASESLRSGFFNHSDGDGESHLDRIHCIPMQESANGIFSIALCINYEELASPANDLIGSTTTAAAVIVAMLVLLIAGVFFMVSARFENRANIKALQDRNRELSNLHKQMSENFHLQRLETIGTMTSGIAHEFNNLLTPIMSYSVLAIDETENECRKDEIQDYLTEIFTTSERAKELIGRISNLSRKNSDASTAPVCLDTVVGTEIDSLKAISPRGIRVEQHLEASDAIIMANTVQISQMIINLLVNASHAIKAKENVGGTITISTRVADGAVVLSVSDTGTGIAEEDRKRIFDPFFTTKQTGQGTGLGLPIVMQIVEEHNGSICVDSKLGLGTTFQISLPLAKEDEDEASEDDEGKTAENSEEPR